MVVFFELVEVALVECSGWIGGEVYFEIPEAKKEGVVEELPELPEASEINVKGGWSVVVVQPVDVVSPDRFVYLMSFVFSNARSSENGSGFVVIFGFQDVVDFILAQELIDNRETLLRQVVGYFIEDAVHIRVSWHKGSAQLVILTRRMVMKILSAPRVWIVVLVALAGCQRPSEEIVLKRINDVVVEASSDPVLRANALFYNPNKMSGRLKRIQVDVYVDGKKAATVDQELKTKIPARGEFTVPLEVRLAIRELGFMNTLLGVLGGKTFDVHYVGSLKLTYRGIPVRVPVDYKDEVKVRF